MIIGEGKRLTVIGDSLARISIIIVTYNAAAHLQKCLNSIYSQQYLAIDIIVVDGKSTDGTIEILKNNTTRIHTWISEKDSGIYDAMNKALKYITGNWVYFLGSDDELRPDFSKLTDALTDVNTIYYANVIHNGIKRSEEVSPYYMAKVGIYHQAIIYPSAIFKKRQYNLKYRIAADYALNMQCFKDSTFQYIYRDYIICNYNHTGISSTVVDQPFENDKAKLILTNFGFKIWARFMFRKLKAVFSKENKILLSFSKTFLVQL
jgi:glycosyltransferase involved in cell wall biosynthesis